MAPNGAGSHQEPVQALTNDEILATLHNNPQNFNGAKNLKGIYCNKNCGTLLSTDMTQRYKATSVEQANHDRVCGNNRSHLAFVEQMKQDVNLRDSSNGPQPFYDMKPPKDKKRSLCFELGVGSYKPSKNSRQHGFMVSKEEVVPYSEYKASNRNQ